MICAGNENRSHKTDGDDRTLSIYVAFPDGSMASHLKAMVSTLAADCRRAFGTAPPGVAYIGLSGDSDDLGMTSRGLIRNIVLR
ncbi:hypothetical protein L2D14_01075 [Thalassospiraceae bacterium LMO-JJ14]|nr:hypothetical protein L2D14_01075 [Thalassospiraceae bacterium LMO-JJ14]